MSTEWKALAKIGIHHEAMKKSGSTFLEHLYEMRISQSASKQSGTRSSSWLHGVSALGKRLSLSPHLGNLLSISLAGPKVGSIWSALFQRRARDSTEWKALAKIGIHHEAMKKSG